MNAKVAELACKEVVELVNEYLGHALTADARLAFEAHLAECPPCTTYLEQIESVVTVAGSLDQAAPSAEVERELLALFQSWHGKSSR